MQWGGLDLVGVGWGEVCRAGLRWAAVGLGCDGVVWGELGWGGVGWGGVGWAGQGWGGPGSGGGGGGLGWMDGWMDGVRLRGMAPWDTGAKALIACGPC